MEGREGRVRECRGESGEGEWRGMQGKREWRAAVSICPRFESSCVAIGLHYGHLSALCEVWQANNTGF